ncbi:MAG: energy-coupling factor transporter transmembrane component T [Roseiflexaceae bacterium]
MLATWSYKERDTIIQRLDPRTRVIFMIATMFATIPIWDLRLVLIPFVLTIAELILARLAWRELRRFVLFVGAFVTFLTLLTLLTGRGGTGVYTIEHMIWQGHVLGLPIVISAERLAFAATQMLRLFTMALLGVILLLTIHPAGYGVTFRRLGLPDNVACALDLAVRFVPSLAGDFTTTLDAQRARGYELERAGGLFKAIRNLAPLIVPITIGAILKGEDVIDAMNLHAFGTGPRTWLQELRYGARDYVVIVLSISLLLGAILLRLGGLGGLWVPQWLLALAS